MKLKLRKNKTGKMNFSSFKKINKVQLISLKGGNDETPPEDVNGKEII
jgi:hypothetical protein